MKKYLRYFRKILRYSCLKMFSYKQDFFVTLLIIPLFILCEVGFIIFTTQSSGSNHILGYTTSELVFLVLLSQFITDIACSTTLTSERLPRQILRGELDGFILKPIRSIVSIGVQQFFIKSLLSLTYIFIALWFTIVVGNIHFSMEQVLKGIFILIQSTILLISINFSAGLLSFFFEGMAEIQNFVLNIKDNVSSYPKEFFPTIFQNIFTFVIPILLIASPMLSVFHNTYSTSDMILGGTVTAVFAIISSVLWSIGLRKYSSAN